MNATLIDFGRNRRTLEVVTSGQTYQVEYNGGIRGIESVSVNGQVVATQQRALGFVLRFPFRLTIQKALLEVRIWPWFSLRSIHLWVEGELVYAEGPGLLRSPADREEQELIEKGGQISVAFLGIGILLLGTNLVMLFAMNRLFPVPLLFAPVALLLGIGGLVDPRVCLLGTHAQGRSFPQWTKVLGNALIVVGFGIGCYLAYLFFR
jgi:hypothetical protein